MEGNLVLWELFVSWSNLDNLGVCSRIFWYFKGIGEFPNKATPMHIPCFLGLEWLIRRALSQDQLPQWMKMLDTRDSLGRTPLHWTAVNGCNEIVRLLLKKGADPRQIDTRSNISIELALKFGNSQAVDSLMSDADFEIPGKWLELAVIGGHISVVKLLLTRGANANVLCPITTFGSPLHAAAFRGHEELVGLLLQAGANVNYTSDKFGTALQVAAFESNFAVAKTLLDCNADPNSKATIYGTALQSAAHRGSVEIVQELILKGADVMAPPGETIGTAMYLAKIAGHEGVEAILAGVGALSEGPRTQRRGSIVDPSMQHAMQLTEQALKNGDLPVLGWQLNRFRSEIHGGLVARNERKLRWALKISVPYFVATLKVGHEGHVAAAVEVAMLIAQDAVESGYEIGLTMVTIT